MLRGGLAPSVLQVMDAALSLHPATLPPVQALPYIQIQASPPVQALPLLQTRALSIMQRKNRKSKLRKKLKKQALAASTSTANMPVDAVAGSI